MAGFTPVLTGRRLIKESNNWYAVDESLVGNIPEEVDPKLFPAGGWKTVYVNAYERDGKARAACLEHHGYRCQGCGVTMKEVYGEMAERVIHVHHIKPVSRLPDGYKIDPLTELVPVCPNCHAVIHAKPAPLSITQLKSCLAANRKKSHR